MAKKIFSVIFAVFLLAASVITPITASAYEVTGFDITANAGMLVSLDTGDILFEKNIDEKVYPASITKIMTGVIILESGKYQPDNKVAITEEVLDMVLGTGLAVSLMTEGEEFTEKDLLYMVLMSSFGDCTYLAAIHYGGSVEGFVAKMNEKAAELGLSGTHYSNPVGLHEEETYTTVRDIYTLATYALKNETFKEITSSTRYTFSTSKSPKKTLTTTNFLIDPNTNYYYPYADGVKTGFTDEAGRCLVSTASCEVKNFKYNYMCILMGCPNKAGKRVEFLQSAELYRWAFLNFSRKEIARSDEPVCEMPVKLSMDADFVPLYFKEPFVSILPNEADDSTIVIKTELSYDSVDAPVKKGTVLGTAQVYYAEKVIGRVELIAGNDVKESQLLIFFEAVKNIFSSKYMKLIYGLIGLGIIIFIIMFIKLNFSKIRKRKVKYIPYKKEKNTYEKD